MVFCIDPVGTVTAWRIKVMPKIAIIRVMTNDSKYSRAVDLGGPTGLAAACSGVSFISFSLVLTKYTFRFQRWASRIPSFLRRRRASGLQLALLYHLEYTVEARVGEAAENAAVAGAAVA